MASIMKKQQDHPCMSNEKHFSKWNQEKQRLHYFGRRPDVHTGEIWWCAMGENIGIEINGKGDVFTRPVIILRKLSKHGFIGTPLTSQPHDGSWYAHFRFKNKDEYAAFSQIRTFSTQRLLRKMGRADDTDMREVKEKLEKFLFLEKWE